MMFDKSVRGAPTITLQKWTKYMQLVIGWKWYLILEVIWAFDLIFISRCILMVLSDHVNMIVKDIGMQQGDH